MPEPLSAADIAALRDLLDAVHPDLLPLSCEQASLSQIRMTAAPIEYVVADANGLEFATTRIQDEETTDLVARAINALPALLHAAEKVAELEAEKDLQESYDHWLKFEFGVDEGAYARFLEEQGEEADFDAQ